MTWIKPLLRRAELALQPAQPRAAIQSAQIGSRFVAEARQQRLTRPVNWNFGLKDSLQPERLCGAFELVLLVTIARRRRFEVHRGDRNAIKIAGAIGGHVVAHLDIAETVAVEAAGAGLACNLGRDVRGDDARLLVGKDTGLG